jgi:hypothetical protein
MDELEASEAAVGNAIAAMTIIAAIIRIDEIQIMGNALKRSKLFINRVPPLSFAQWDFQTDKCYCSEKYIFLCRACVSGPEHIAEYYRAYCKIFPNTQSYISEHSYKLTEQYIGFFILRA